MLSATLLLIVLHSAPKTSPKICVANLANASTVSAFLERLPERLVRNIKRNKLEAVAMDSSTTMQRKLRPTQQNSDEAEDKQCDYTLLTQIVDTRTIRAFRRRRARARGLACRALMLPTL